jgi:glycosyltransferase involved in cell wall biosynthesis
VTGYDLVISTSSAVAKGVITGPDQVHISYTFSPIRYAWDLQETYLRESGIERGLKSIFARVVLHYLRLWDVRTAHGVDHFIAISGFIERRIRKAYGRRSTVIYPPVNLDRFTRSDAREDFYVTMSRMVPYKRIPLIVEAFSAMPERRLVVIGDGPDMEAARRLAGPNVTLMGKQSDAVVVDHLQRARAFLFAAEEDFGIAPVEAQACGTPVIAYGKGAALETIRGDDGEGQTGVFFVNQTVASIVEAVKHFEQREPLITAAACRTNAERFSTERFHDEIRRFVDTAMATARTERQGGLAHSGSDRVGPQPLEDEGGPIGLHQINDHREMGRPGRSGALST